VSAPSLEWFVAISTTTPGARTAFARNLRFFVEVHSQEEKPTPAERDGKNDPVHLLLLGDRRPHGLRIGPLDLCLGASVKTFGRKASSLYFRQVSRVIGFAPVERRNWYAAQVTRPAALTTEKGVARKTAKNTMHEASPISPSAAPTHTSTKT